MQGNSLIKRAKHGTGLWHPSGAQLYRLLNWYLLKWCNGFRREVICGVLGHLVKEKFSLGVLAIRHCPRILGKKPWGSDRHQDDKSSISKCGWSGKLNWRSSIFPFQKALLYPNCSQLRKHPPWLHMPSPGPAISSGENLSN